MKLLQDALAGTVIVAALVGAGIWYAHDPDCRQWPFSYFHGSPKVAGLPNIAISRIDWSADGQKLLVRYRGEPDAQARLALHDAVETAGSLPIETAGTSLNSAALAPDARHVEAGSYDHRLWWIKLDSSDPPVLLVKVPVPTVFTTTAAAQDGRLVVGGTNEGSIYLCDVTRRTWTVLETGRQSALSDLRFSRDGLRLIAAQYDGQGSVWDVTTGAMVQKFVGHAGPMTAADFLPDGKRIMSAGRDDTVRIWEIASGRELWRGEFGLSGVNTLALSPDGRTAAWGGFDHRIIVWDLVQEYKILQIATSAAIIFHLKFSPDGAKLAAAGWEGTVRLYDVQTAAETRIIEVAPPQSL